MIRGGHGLSFPIATQKAREQPTAAASCSWVFGLAVEACRFQPQSSGRRVARMGQVQMKGSPARESQEGKNGSGGHHGMRRRSTPPFPALSQGIARRCSSRAFVLLPGGLAGLLGAALLTGSAPPVPSPPALAGLLRVGWPVLAADRHLRRLGWRPAPGRQPDALDRKLAGNSLASLSDCSGTGLGFCRYDYRRDAVNLSVITLPEQAILQQVMPAQKLIDADQVEPKPPGATGGARVVRWLHADSGRTWGLCPGSELPYRLVSCPEP